jgi:hypothetical protein
MPLTDTVVRDARRIRAAGIAALAFAVFQLWALPAPLWYADGRWVWSAETIVSVGLTLAVGVAALRGSRAAAVILGGYGGYRLGWFVLGIVQVLDGTAARDAQGPAFVLGAAMGVPFAIFWVRGGLAAWRAIRTRATLKDAAI